MILNNQLSISQKINIGNVLIFLLALLSIFFVIETRVKPALIAEREKMIESSQQDMLTLIGSRLQQIQQLTAALAIQSQLLPKDEVLFKQLFPPVIDNHGDKAIAGGGIWPEPETFTPGIARRSFFWGRDNGQLKYLDDYNSPSGNGYHNESWYQIGRQGQDGVCKWSPAYTDPFTKTPMITCTVPMHAKGQFMGVTTVDMMLDGIADQLTQYGKANGGYAFAVDQVGQILSFPHNLAKPDIDGNLMSVTKFAVQQPWLAPVVSGLDKEQTAMMLPHDEILGEAAYVSLHRLPASGWTIGLVVPKSHMVDMAQQMAWLLMVAVGTTLAIMLVIGWFFFRGVIRGLLLTTTQIQVLASGNGDVERRLTVSRRDELGSLCKSVNDYADKFKQILLRTQTAANTLQARAGELNTFSNTLRQEAQELRDENTLLATGAHQMGATSQEVARHAVETEHTVTRLYKEVRSSGTEMDLVIGTMESLAKVIQQAREAIGNLAQDSTQVSNMLGVIRDISEQTNLLALNAAIEAARAGESGRGFAVVADEVRNLAAKSQRSAVEIEKVLSRLQATSGHSVSIMGQGQEETDKAVSIARQTHQHLQSVVTAFSEITERTSQIAVAAEQQERVTQEMSHQLQKLNQLTDGNAKNVQQLSQMSNQLSEVAGQLTRQD
ncbi:methyl-accepting chemotaxis protein [Aeromonas jandaei]|uniref:methyl-accepting chemotaxis protein n=1 Tax=Aeromonas jandaei TaxID=650 RepID=UPI00191F35E4|nr:methyl-accepting chemotaxis protein [Aeromonas jandaei]MBL0599087.1 methyl-accepting chemotaxis protein [Aeromonas jandaei]